MCGIAGVVGLPGASTAVHEALKALEYRGYDSCGIAWTGATKGARLEVRRAVGPVAGLRVPSAGSVALGHTRWATHGAVTEANAHPHLDCTGRAAIVHNGVLSNHGPLRDQLQGAGHEFRSATDSEVLAHLWERSAAPDGRGPGARVGAGVGAARGATSGDGAGMARLRALLATLKGTYSVCILDGAEGSIYFAKERNPLWLAKKDGVTWLASDPIALRPHASRAVPLEDGDHGRAVAGSWELFDRSGQPVPRAAVPIDQLDDRVDKAGHEHFMLKEIHEAPMAMNRLLIEHVLQERPFFDVALPRPAGPGGAGPPASRLPFTRALCLGAGTSHHAAILGSMYLERLAGITAVAKTTPEYKDDVAVPEAGSVVLAFSQSGETLDTLQALHRLRSHSHPLVALTNQPSSSIARQADQVIPLLAGPEVSVASTKTFLSQCLASYLFALAAGRESGIVGDAQAAHAARTLMSLPRALDRTLRRNEAIARLARELVPAENVFLLAKGWLLPAAMEGALKLKEIAYQHAEAYPAGELKHGPFALLGPNTPVIFLHQADDVEEAVLNSIQEVQARGAPTYVLAAEGTRIEGVPADRVVWLPAVEPQLAPLVFSCALHLLAYWTAKGRALPIDRPRNLAKSVTVE